MHRLWGGEEIAVSATRRVGVKLTLVMCFAAVITAAVPLHALPAEVASRDGHASSSVSEASQAVQVSVSVEAVRLLVVGKDGRIAAIYSNTSDPRRRGSSGYVLRARSETVNGAPLSPIPAPVLAEYQELLPRLDWSVRGLVYSVP